MTDDEIVEDTVMLDIMTGDDGSGGSGGCLVVAIVVIVAIFLVRIL